MSVHAGTNLQTHTAAQIDFAAHIRNPQLHPRPADVDARRMQIYLDLFYNNIENFLASAYPIAKSCFAHDHWHQLVREFVHSHASTSPLFLEISQEFLVFLNARGLVGLPDFLLELCHYEWVELALDVAIAEPEDEEPEDEEPEDEEPPHAPEIDMASEAEKANALAASFRVSSVAMPLAYAYAVQKIGPAHQPQKPPVEATYLIVHRTPRLDVRFIASNAVTHRLLGLLESANLQDCLELIGAELRAAGHAVDDAAVTMQGLSIVSRLCGSGVLRRTQAK